MPCKCCLEILNNNLISEFVFISAVLFGTMGQWSMPWELVALAHLRPPPPLLDSPVLDMPLLPGSCPHSPFPLTPWLLLLSQVAQDHQQGNAERQAPTCQGYSLSREVLGSDFVSKFSWFFFFFFYCWLPYYKIKACLWLCEPPLPKITCTVSVTTLLWMKETTTQTQKWPSSSQG